MEGLLAIEKTQRLVRPRRGRGLARPDPEPPGRAQAADAPGTKLAVVAVVRACFNCKAWPALNENVLLISKRRSQLKQARGGASGRAQRLTSRPPRRLSPRWCRSA